MASRRNSKEWMARSLMVIIFLAGLMGILFQFMAGMHSLALLSGMGVLGAVVATSREFDEWEHQLFASALSNAFQWTAYSIFIAFVIYEVLQWLGIGASFLAFTGERWPGLVFSVMLVCLGAAGVRSFRKE